MGTTHGGRRGPLWEKGTQAHPRSSHEYESSAGVADFGEIDNANSLSSERVSSFEASFFFFFFSPSQSRTDSFGRVHCCPLIDCDPDEDERL